MASKWKKYKLKDVCTNIFSGGTPDTRNEAYWNGDVPWLSSGETGNRYIYDTIKKISRVGVKNSSTRLAHIGDTVIASAGQGFTRGQAAYLLIDTYINQSTITLEANKQIVDQRFLFFNLSSRYSELRDISDSNSSRGSLTTKLLGDLDIPLPPLPEQRAIAGILGALDDKIELNCRMNRTLEEMAHAVYKELIGEAQGYKTTIGELVTIVGGSTPSRATPAFWEGGDICWATPKDLAPLKSPILLDTSGKITKLGLKQISSGLLPVGTVLLSSRAPIGYLAITQIPVAINQGFIAIKCTDEIPNYFILNWLKDNMDEIIGRANGTTFMEISKFNFRPIQIAIPPFEKMSEFVKIVEPIYQRIVASLEEINTITEIRDTLLPKLISDQIQASPVLENDDKYGSNF